MDLPRSLATDRRPRGRKPGAGSFRRGRSAGSGPRGVVPAAVVSVAAAAILASAPAARADGPAVAEGTGGAVASVDAEATRAGLSVLRDGGTAADAAIATAAALGVTEPYSAGVGGGGFMVVWDARSRRATTIDGRETAPASLGPTGFIDPATGKARDFKTLVSSGLSVGVPGTPATWAEASRRFGRISLGRALGPAARLADRGFIVDRTFRDQTVQNQERFARFPATAKLFLPGGQPTPVGARLKNPDLARTYRQLARRGVEAMYDGPIGRDVVRTVQRPPGGVLPGGMKAADLRRYEVRTRGAIRSTFRGLDVLGMPTSSSGGIAIAEALNVIEALGPPAPDQVTRLHRYLEASRLAYADRGRWVGDDRFVDVPREALTSKAFARSRACLIRPDAVLPNPQVAGDPASTACGSVAPAGGAATREGPSTTHLVTADRWGNVVSYTLTIEQTGGSGIAVPGRGFLLNNELTDFDAAPPAGLTAATDPNLPAPGKRPRSSMSPTIVLRDGRPWLAIGSPGGATIISTVLQTLLGRIDDGLPLVRAVAAPRISQRNGVSTEAEPAFLAGPNRLPLKALGHRFVQAPPTFSPDPEIGAVAALERRPAGGWTAVAEPARRGGGAAGVVKPAG